VSSPLARAKGRIDWALVMQRFETFKVLDSGDVGFLRFKDKSIRVTP
jgi:hypothetical protein